MSQVLGHDVTPVELAKLNAGNAQPCCDYGPDGHPRWAPHVYTEKDDAGFFLDCDICDKQPRDHE